MKKIIINAEQWQIRVAIVQNNELKNIYFEPHSHSALERSFFKGKVSKVLPGIQTAFVDIGQERSGFLHISEIDRELALNRIGKIAEWDEEEPKTQQRQPNTTPDISKILTEGEPILVQVAKEPVYEKGAKLTTCFTLPGRFFVLMPNIPRIGISKKIEDKEERQRFKNEVRTLLPEGMGVIIRTSVIKATQKEINKDLEYLLGQWRDIEKNYQNVNTETKIHQDIDLVLQIIRDHLDSSIEAIVVDDKQVQSSIYKFIKAFASEYSHIVHLYEDSTPLFEKFDIEKQVQSALEKKVALKSGGSLIVETTEAMTVVDVNTGKFIGKSNLEETIFKTNIEAAEEIARQLCLRNIGGLIVIDFIDMAFNANRQKVFKFFEKTLKEQDKFQSVILKISEFGLVQMTRKRSGKTLMQQLMYQCPSCKSLGFIKSIETQAYELLRQLKNELARSPRKKVLVSLHPELFKRISTIEYNGILALEKSFSGKITLVSDQTMHLTGYKIAPE